MPLITIPGDPAADSYVGLAEFKEYCERVGYGVDGKPDAELEQALRRGTAWLDGTYGARFIGEPATVDQSLEWPRKNAVWRGAVMSSANVPRQIKNATCEAAWREITTPGSLSPDYNGAEQIKRKRSKVGDLEKEIEYADLASSVEASQPVITQIDGILTGFISAKSSTGTAFVRRA